MWDAVFLVLLANAQWMQKYHYVAPTGFPLALLTIWGCWTMEWLPRSVYVYETTVFKFCADVWILVVFLDALQTLVHWLSHTHLRRTWIGRSHALHHVYVRPTPQEAFVTGIVDAFAQLILPLLVCIHLVGPSRGSLIAFGALYSNWLHFLHSAPQEFEWLRCCGIVDPAHHHEHHRNPRCHFSTVFMVC